jgi:hypothetical protein
MADTTESTRKAEKILARLKGLRGYLQPDEFPLLNVPAIWDGGSLEQSGRSMPCDVVVTNQRIFGYALTTFPRTRLFLDALSLPALTTISLRQKNYEPLFRELLISDGRRKIYIRTRYKQMQALYDALRMALECYTSASTAQIAEVDEASIMAVTPVYGAQDIRVPFEHSLLAIVLLFVGGLVLEMVGALAWVATSNAQVGWPLCVAGFVSVITAIALRRRR